MLPPRSTLFPYTTLFRSVSTFLWGKQLPTNSTYGRATRRACSVRSTFARGSRRKRGATPNVDRDRKSTRLNSSHPSISYAVFCLKKKNIFFLLFYSLFYI